MKKVQTIVFMGDGEKYEALQRVADERGWNLLEARQPMEMLAMYVFYYPDLFILDAERGAECIEEVIFHLRSVQIPPLLILTNEPERPAWQHLPAGTVRLLPASSRLECVIAVIDALLAAEKWYLRL